MAEIPKPLPTIQSLRAALATGAETPTSLATRALASSNRNQYRNTYLWQSPAFTLAQAANAQAIPPASRTPLWGLPVSVKDCFDLAGAPTSCGTHFYRSHNGIAAADSWLVHRLQQLGAVITGKTHLHPLAYGITGQNPDFGDCLQPLDPTSLTGGSSSGAAASMQEGSAAIAIGTDTGGSIRVPAALCGLAGYRASANRGDWTGAHHLAPSFDTMGCLFRSLADAPLLATLFTSSNPTDPSPAPPITRFAFVGDAFLASTDPPCDPAIVAAFHTTIRELESLGLHSTPLDVSWWADSFDIFAPIQASQAARIHAPNLAHIEPSLRARLEWGASISAAELTQLHLRQRDFVLRMDDLFTRHQAILLPAAPVARLAAGAGHTHTRARLLRYTTPFSLAGCPVVTIPGTAGGMQLAAAPGQDEPLLQLAAQLGSLRSSHRTTGM